MGYQEILCENVSHHKGSWQGRGFNERMFRFAFITGSLREGSKRGHVLVSGNRREEGASGREEEMWNSAKLPISWASSEIFIHARSIGCIRQGQPAVPASRHEQVDIYLVALVSQALDCQ
jgi:hypothetical protein